MVFGSARVRVRLRSLVRTMLAMSMSLGSLAIGPVAAQTQSAYVCRGFAVPTDSSQMPIVTAKDGDVWFVAKNANRLIRVHEDHSFTPIVPVDGTTTRLDGLALGADGSIWYSKDTAHRIGRLPAGGGKGREYELPAPNVFTSVIAAAADGRIWYADPVANKVGTISGDGNVVAYDAPTVNGAPLSPAGIAVAADGSVWVTSVGLNAVYRVDPASGAFTRFDIATPDAQPSSIIRGPHGDLWFIMPAIEKLGRITTDGRITEYASDVIGLNTLAVGPDGAIWYGSNQKVGRLDATGHASTFACEGGGGMTVGPDHRLWVLGSGNGQMYEVSERREGVAAHVVSSGGSIKTISADRIGAVVGSSGGRVVVQYSSNDPGCGYCIRGNRHFESLAATGTSATYYRVLYEPWTSAKDSGEAARVHLVGLPTIVVFDHGKETSRYEGDAALDVVRAKLRL